ncbi:MAG: cell surface protein SprA [Bacteroidaceae bacterium]|nr:cell surface protein SprA [Bacteroidaceae bacterium]
MNRYGVPMVIPTSTAHQSVSTIAEREMGSMLPDVAREDTIITPVQRTDMADPFAPPTYSGDLRTPENIQSGVFYDEKTGQYRFGTRLSGNTRYLSTPMTLSPEEFGRRSTRNIRHRWFVEQNRTDAVQQGKEKFDFTDMHFDLGIAEKIFGPGGVRIKTQGSASLKIGANTRFVDNPSLSERNRNVFGFDFDEDINLSLNARVGDKVNMDFNYNSKSAFTFDTQNIRLRYEGKEDEMLRVLEAGNISMPATSSLIRGASSLFGIRADFKFGRLSLSTVISQKKSSSTNVSSGSGGVQLQSYEVNAADYDENRHFFLAHFFRDRYDTNMSQLPNILSGVSVNRVEIWVTNNTGQTTNTRDLIALTDLGEQSRLNTDLWTAGSVQNPANSSNDEYATLTSAYATARDISQATTVLDAAGMEGGKDYEKVGSARKLNPSEYKLNSTLGYVSLSSTLQTDQVLAIAYEYTYRGQTYQVGEFSTDIADNSKALFVKALKNTAGTPQQGNWDLMMKNVYYLGATNLQKDKFRLDIKFLSDTSGVQLSYLPESGLREKKIIQLLGMDRLDNNNKRNPNSYYDYVEGYTVDASGGRVIFPVVEPFGSYMRQAIGNDAVADRYVFQELYDSTRTIARQIAEKNKYTITGEYRASRNDEISLGATNIPRGSVVVTAGGQKLIEGTDYTVDYYSGIVHINNQSILAAGTPVNVSLESNTDYGMQRKTMLGLNWQYDFSKNLTFGGTLLHLREQALTTKVTMGSEPINNTLWGLNLAWKTESQWLTNLFDRLPLLHLTQPSSINFSAEFAQLIAGKNSQSQSGSSYLDDFENANTDYDISDPREWVLSSTPSMFVESAYNSDVRYGYNRALMAWYYIDPLFTRRTSSLAPGYIKNDLAQLSDPFVREVYINELFPNRSINYKESSTLRVLNLAYYPNERGPYNLDPGLDSDGRLPDPQKRWGGMMRKLETPDFETANIEFIEFWLLDPFVKARTDGSNPSGDLYINLGEVSEDILKDGKKFYESGLPTNDASTQYEETVWGRVPRQTSVTYAFNTESGSRSRQDVGLNGLTSTEEQTYGAYADYLAAIRNVVRPEVYDSILANPSGDRYHYFRGTDYNDARLGILDRYKYINHPNGNSVDAANSPESYSTAYKTTPDVEDINQDYTLNEYEKYYQYHIHIDPAQMQVGQNFIVDSRTATPTLRDGSKPEVTWYLFRIPVEQFESRVGNINDFSSIRFMRMFLTGFSEPVVLRFGTFNLVRGEWRNYEQALYNGEAPTSSGTLAASSVSFEENAEKSPVNYVIPPGISRVLQPGSDQILENDEQALALVVENLASGDARAVYKNTNLDLRNYRHLQMYVHANALTGDNQLENGQMSLFLRLGTDFKSNFYEYEIPLVLTPEGRYTQGANGALAVWPEENMIELDFSKLTGLKRNRNLKKSQGQASFGQLYSEYDNDRPQAKLSVMGNPSLGDVRVMMIGVRNNSRATRSVEVWANELRLQNFANDGGWAARAQLNVQVSDFATLNLTGHMETEGFGGLEETITQRRKDNLTEYTVTTNVQLGKLLPEKAKLNAPLYYSYGRQTVQPKYNPLDTDMSMDESLDGLATEHERDSLRNITDRVVRTTNLSLTGVRFGIATKNHPMPYDPANFTFGFSTSKRYTTGETTVWERDQDWKYSLAYSYSPVYKSFEPFKKMKGKSKWLKFFKEFGFNFLPQSITFNSDITRHYYEYQERDVENLDNNSLPLTWSSDFFWNRSFSLRWDLTKNLHASFQSATNAEIEQPYTPVNRDLFPDQYTAWKDSVWRSIAHLGTPLTYQQAFEASLKLPINKLPVFDWVTSDVTYNATYNWTRGADLDDGTTLGNTIANNRSINGNLRLNFETLYNHIPFLKAANQRFSGSSSSSGRNNQSGARGRTGSQGGAAAARPRNFEKEVQLMADTTVTLAHGQKSKKIRVTAIREDGTRYPIRYKIKDQNTIIILTQDTVKVKVTVAARKKADETPFYKSMQAVARVAMMVRNVSVAYRNTFNMSIPGFLPNVGDAFGQRSSGGLAPGLDFAFGFTGENYIEKAVNRGWLLCSDSIITPAATSLTEDLQIRATLEPWPNLKIDLSASRNENRTRSIQYMYAGMPMLQSGSFTMTTISLNSAFASMGSADDNYNNATFNKFVSSLEATRNAVEAQYVGAVYPQGTALAGETFDPANGAVSPYSADVMIPAFLKTYTLSGGSLRIFPTLAKLLPNWNVQYSGLAKLNAMKRIFKSFNLNHGYKSLFKVGSYNTFTSFCELTGGLGFVPDVTTGAPIPSSMYDVSTVALEETFSPLFGVDMTFLNNLSVKVEWRRTRVTTLSMTSQQITEKLSNDFVIGLGYKIVGLKLFQPKRTVRGKGRSRSRTASDADSNNGSRQQNNNTGWASDLNLKLDISLRNQTGVQRNIQTLLSQATDGNQAVQISFSADYALSKFLTVTAYYDRQMNKPLLTSTSYPVTTQDFGVSLKFSLAR